MPPNGSSICLPAELRSVKGKVLEDYVRSRILDFAGGQVFAKKLYTSPATVRAAAQDALQELLRPGDNAVSKNLKLVFRHTCLSLGCLDGDCQMCKNTPHRRCTNNFAQKYLSGDAIKSKCGATIDVEVIDRSTGEVAPPEAVAGLHLEICVLEGKSYADALPEVITDAFLDSNTLLTDAKGKGVLAPGRGCEKGPDMKVIARFHQGKAELSVNIIGSSIAMLSGQKPPFRLLVRAIDSETGQRVDRVQWAVSDAFVVATQRVKGAQKAEIPHIEEHVSKIENVGVQTQNKLQDIRAAAVAAGIPGLSVVHNTITTVGQFKDLVESSAKDVPLQETLRKVLNFTSKGWDAAKAHALRAVETDNKMRVWMSDDTHTQGLLYQCHLGRINIDSPIGMLKGRGAPIGSRQVELEAILVQHPAYDKARARRQQRQAVECWWRPGHPGWSVWFADSEKFVRGVVEAGDAASSQLQIGVPLPSTSHASYRQGETDKEAGEHIQDQRASNGQPISTETDPAESQQRSKQTAVGSASSGPYSLFQEARGSKTSHQGTQQTSGSKSAFPPSSSSVQHSPATSQPSRDASWPFNVPLVNGTALRDKGKSPLPQSPFDVPLPASTSAPAVSAALQALYPTSSAVASAATVGKMDSFSFQPGASRIGNGSEHSLSGLPNHLPTLTTLELEQIMELQRALTVDRGSNDAPAQLPLHFLSSMGQEGGQQEALPQLLTRLSGLIGDAGAVNDLEALPSSGFSTLLAPFARFQQAIQQDEAHANGEMGEDAAMPPKFSGKVSGILDDLSDAMSMLKDLLPSANSELHMQEQASTSTADPGGGFDPLHFTTSFPMPNMASYTLPKPPPLSVTASGEGSAHLSRQGDLDGPFSGAKRKR